MDLLYFIVLVSVLIFVHELGHFTVAKLFGIKVLTFSVGFGPKIIRLRGRETEYCLGIFPLGGFVTMLEESRGEAVLPEDRPRTFEAQAIWKRLLVVVAGPVMNLVFPVLLYFCVFATDRMFVPPTIGIVQPGHPADGKLQEGDRVMSVDGEDIGTFSELSHLMAKSPGREVKLKVFRNLGYLDIEVTPEEVQVTSGFGEVDRVGRLFVSPHAPAAVIGISRGQECPAFRGGLRSFDLLTSIGGRPIKLFSDVERIMLENRGETVPVTYLRPRFLDGALGGFADMGVYEAGVAALTPEAGDDLLTRTGIESADLYVAFVPPGSAQAKANIQRGDKIVQLDDKDIPAWSVLLERLFAQKEAAHKLSYVRDGKLYAGHVELRHETHFNEAGEAHDRFALRMEHWAPTVAEPLVLHPHRYTYAASQAVGKTFEVGRFIVVGIVHLVQGKVSLSQVSGPIAIYEIAGREGAKGTDYFLWVMAVISINLGLLNLMPIPVLDGGHVVFLASEAALRRPLPLRVREVASLLGMLVLVGLMGVAFKNDVERRWDVIAGQLKELFG